MKSLAQRLAEENFPVVISFTLFSGFEVEYLRMVPTGDFLRWFADTSPLVANIINNAGLEMKAPQSTPGCLFNLGSVIQACGALQYQS